MASRSWLKFVRKISRSMGFTERNNPESEAAAWKPKKIRKLGLELLEERTLLTTIDYTVDLANYGGNPAGLLDGDVDLTLRVADGGSGAAVLQLVDLDRAAGGQVVGTAPFTGPIQVNITGFQTQVQGHTEEFPESLTIDLANNTPFNPAAVAIGVNFDGIKGTAVGLIQDDVLTIAPTIVQGGSVYSPASLDVTLSHGEKISVTGPVSATGHVTLTANDGDIELLNDGATTSGSIIAGDITLAAVANVTAQSEADSADALAMPSASIHMSGGTITGDNISLLASATTNVTISATDLKNGQFSVGGVIAISSASVTVDANSVVNATGALAINATSDVTTNVTRGAQDDGDANDDDKDQDAAIAVSAVTSSASVHISDTANLTAGGAAGISATNLVNVTTTADGTLHNGSSGGNDAGGTLATATVVGDTEVVVEDSASITSGADLSLAASSNRTVTTTSRATSGGSADDGDSNTTTQGQQALSDNNASTADGDMTLAAAIAVNTVMGETRARVTGGSLTSTGGNILIESEAQHNIATIADGTTTTGQNGTGVGVAVAIGLNGVPDPNGAVGLRSTAAVSGSASMNANAINIQATMPNNIFTTEANSGMSGPSKDENDNDTGADVGVAGALAIGVSITSAQALLEPTANVNANGSDLNLSAQSTTNSTVKAMPNQNAVSGESLGIGASVAVNITDHTTRAAIENGATITGANDVSLSAVSFQGVTTLAEAGAAGGTAIAASVAFGLGNHDTLAQIGTGSPLTTTGNVSASAVHTASVTAASQGDAEGGEDAAVGAAFAMDLLSERTEASVNRSVTSGGAMTLSSTENSTSTTTSKASAKGEDDDGGDDDANSQAGNQRNSGNTQATSRGARDSNGAGANPNASTTGNDDGSVTVAAAIALNIAKTTASASIADGVTIDADGKLTVISNANTHAMAIADGSATHGEDAAVGAAVALNLAFVDNVATIGNGANINSDGLSLKATMNDAIHTVGAQSTSGAGASGVGVAGSFSLSFSKIHTEANIQPDATVTMADGGDPGNTVGPVEIEAVSLTSSTTKATASAMGDDAGVGASIAINITDHDTRAEVEDSALIVGARDVTLTAQSKNDVVTEVKGGAAGGTAITPVVAVTLAFPTTEARLGTQVGTQTQTGSLTVLAVHSGTVDGDATGKTTGEDAGIGASLGFTYVEENTSATTARSLTTTGPISFTARSSSTHTTDAVASAAGAKGDSQNSGGNVQSKTDNQRAAGNSQSMANGGGSSGTDNKATASTADGKDQDSDGDSVNVAAAIAVSIVDTKAKAEIGDGLTIKSGGLMTVRAYQNADSSATASGEAVNGDVGIGAAVAINVVDVSNQARVGSSSITSDGLVIEAGMTDGIDDPPAMHSFGAQAKSGAGGKDAGVAGSLAINHAAVKTSAVIASGADVNMADGADAGSSIGPVSIQAKSTTANVAKALPVNGGAQSDSVGVGASVALNLVYHDTTAEIQDGVTWSGSAASSVTVDATASHTMTTDAENGAKTDGVGIGGAVAVVIAKNNTTARVGNGSGAISTSGTASIQASHTSSTSTTVSSAATGSDAAIGASVGVNLVTESAKGELARDLTATGAVSVTSQIELTSTLNVKASAGGGDDEGDDADTESNKQANQSNATSDGGNDVPKSSDSTDKAQDESDSESSSSGGGVGIAASVAVNALSIKNSALISNGADVTANGSVQVSAPAHVVAHSESDSSAIDLQGDVSVGAAVALNVVSLTNSAIVGGDSTVSGNGITVEAITTDDLTNDYTATAFAVAGNTGEAGVAGVVAINVVDADTTAMTADNSHLDSTGNVTVTAEHAMRAQAGAIAGTFSSNAAVAAAVAINVLGLNEDQETGGSQTLASIGDPNSAGSGATVQADGAVKVSASHIIGMFPILNVPDLLNDPPGTDYDDYAIADFNAELASVAISGGGSSGSVGFAGSVGVNLFETTTHAGLDRGATVDGASMAISSSDTNDTNTLAGAIGIGLDGAGIGAGLDLGIVHKDTAATIGRDATATVAGTLSVTANSNENVLSVAANAGVGNSAGIAGSASVQVIETTTQAAVEDGTNANDGASMIAGGSVTLSSNDTFGAKMIGGAVGAAGTAGVGASNTTLVHNDVVTAHVGDWASVMAGGSGLSLSATSSEALLTVAAAGGGGGTAGVAGSAVVNILNETTTASIGRNATITATNGALAGESDVNVAANDTTTIVSVAGSLAAAGTAAAGIGADVAKISKNTTAFIDSNVTATVEGDVLVNANSVDDITSVAAGLAAAGSVGIAVDASVHILDAKTRAFIGDDPNDNVASAGAGDVHANGSVVVAANDQTETDKVVGVLGVAGAAGVAAGAGVSVTSKTTEAFIGNGAKVTADGKNAGLDVRTGRFVETFVTPAATTTPGIQSNSDPDNNVDSDITATVTVGDLSAKGEVGLPPHIDSDTDQNGKDNANDQGLKKQRIVTPQVQSGFHGIAVTATNRDDIEVYTISVSAAGAAAVAISAGVNVIDNDTRAYIGENAKVNDNLSTANDAQSVHVAAGSDFAHVAFSGAVAAAGGAGVGPAASVTVLSNTTEAYIGWTGGPLATTGQATAKAKNDVTVEAHQSEDILLVGLGFGGGTVGIGAGVDVLSIDNDTHAAVGPNSLVFAGGDVFVQATDDTDFDVISGGGGAGLAGVGGAVGITTVTKDTQAWIDSGATVDGRGAFAPETGIFNGDMNGDGDSFVTTSTHGVIVQASSKEDVFHLAAAVGAGFVGVSGGVTVTLVDSNTSAEIKGNAQINQTDNALASSGQSVYVNAANESRIISFAGAVAGGAGAAAGGVDYGTLKNDVGSPGTELEFAL